MAAPPRPSRRPPVIAIVLGLALIVIVAVGVPLLIHESAPAVSHRTVAASRPSSTSSTPSPSATANDPGDINSLDALLTAQAAALLRGDEHGWLAPIDPHATSALASYTRIFHNMHVMHVSVWTQAASWGGVTKTKAPYEVEVSYCLVVAACSMNVVLNITAELRHGKIMIESLAAPLKNIESSEPFPWQIETLSAVVGPRVVVAASSAEAYRLRSVLPMAVAAAKVADGFARWGKPSIYVLYLADDSEFNRWFDLHEGHDIGYEVTIENQDLEAVVLLPEALNESGPGGLRFTIQHEFGHVATLQGLVFNGDNTLVEGIADFCGATGHPSWESGDRFYAMRQFLRSGRWTKKIFMTKEITSKNLTTSNAAYGIGYLALRYLAQTYGLAKMLAFWGDVEHDQDALNDASKKEFHKTWKSVNASAVNYVEHTAGL